ncbi:hypothetical protein CPHLJ_4g745 [Cryptosporidium parvum]|uniref:Ribonuclease P/MRP protein subunit n=2 Tax=Cryptosporidium TaxID=5806 RepID=A0A0S4TDK4_CRYHO|nr:Ribonuclease P/MRP protein subunit [Cryptosporidium hominis]QOY41964.1 Ribonuclease P/MRP protein subunit [Cryptosporidium parvum]WKS77267.1 hypothetical protein CPCDC_4g745 [Cryptosporidium sp. 43IA8]WRK32064.1 Ribonuclease P/MRP protein subunit [Cryptosporidium parvum]CUV05454.1 unnamed protein product [Cryptosporidium hominis]|eukprot:QOY41964.1 hypothetical protein CPATCC_001556 [Cryptosporidium parvum]
MSKWSFTKKSDLEYILIKIEGIPKNFINADLLNAIINSSILNILGNIGSAPIKYHILFLSDQTNHAILVTDVNKSCQLRFCLSMISSWDNYPLFRINTIKAGSTFSTVLSELQSF